MATIQGVYVALFGRPADPTGLAYFNSVTKNGADLNGIGDLASTQEYKDRFAGQNNTQIVNSIYQSLFGRDAEAAGLTFFVNALNNGTLNIKNIAIAILDGAQGSDKTVVTNKVAAADLYTKALDTGPEIVAYSGNAAAAQGRTFLSTVKDTVPTSAAVDTAVAAMVTASNGGGTGTTGVTLTLQAFGTVNADFISPDQANSAFKTTAGNDTIRGLAAGDFSSADSIDGGAGTDTINAIVGANASINPILKSVEVVNLDANNITLAAGTATVPAVPGPAAAAVAGQSITFDAGSSTGIQQLNVKNVVLTAGQADAVTPTTNLGTSLVFNNVDKAIAVGLTNVASAAGAVPALGDAANVIVNYTGVAGGSDSATLNVNGVNGAAASLVVSTAGIENLTVNTSGAASQFIAKDAQLQKLVITGDQNLTISNDTGNTAQKVVDASAFTGVLTYTATGNGETITTGSKADAISLGAGNDTLVYTKASQSALGTSDVISNFNAGTSTTSVDKIDVKAFGIDAASTFATAAFKATGDNAGFFSSLGSTVHMAAIVDGGNTLVYVDANHDGNFSSASDLVITLVGNQLANLDKGDFILT